MRMDYSVLPCFYGLIEWRIYRLLFIFNKRFH